MATTSRVQSIAATITSRHKVNECLNCAEALEAAFQRAGVKGSIMKLTALGRRSYIVMRDPNFKIPWGTSAEYTITNNGNHYGVRVGEIIFDNIHRAGIEYTKWADSFTCDTDRMKIEVLREF